jgi:hypothetical protein
MAFRDPSSRRGRLVWVALGVTVLAAAVLASWLVLRRQAATQAPPDEVQAAAAKFLDQVREGQVEQAWNDTTAEFKSMLGLDGFRQLVRTHPDLKQKAEFQGLEMITRNEIPLASCRFQVQDVKRKKTTELKVIFAREQGVWKVERLLLD